MMKRLYVLLFTLSIFSIGKAQQFTVLSGVVKLVDGTPDKGALVVFYPFGPSSGLQQTSTTNDVGEFSLSVAYRGSGLLSASKVDQGYPDAAEAFYPYRSYRSVRELDLDGRPISGLVLQFSSPSPYLQLTVDSEAKEIPTLGIMVKSVSRPNVYRISTLAFGKVWSFVLPEDAVTVTVTAEGYRTWTYTTNPRTPINGALRLVVRLQKISG